MVIFLVGAAYPSMDNWVVSRYRGLYKTYDIGSLSASSHVQCRLKAVVVDYANG
jgi:hypothetical protein